MTAKPWDREGPERRRTPAGLEDALRRLHEGTSRKPTDADRPPASTFAMTPAALAALRYRRGGL